MSKTGSPTPEKLKQDAIVEAIFELRFLTTTPPEFLLVRLADFWKDFSQSRLPAYGIPDPIRTADPNFRYQPVFELLESTNQRSVRIGPNVLSYHLRSPYNGWPTFGTELDRVTAALFKSANDLMVSRLGLRYINALTPADHGIHAVSDLDMSVRIGDVNILDGINVNVTKQLHPAMACIVRVATPGFITGLLPAGTSVLADIDVFTPDPFEARNHSDVMKWVESAHAAEKREFFALLNDQTVDDLREI